MADPATLVPLPPPDSFNTGLVSPTQDFMLSMFGRPGPLGPDCGGVDPAYAVHVVIESVGPFRVTGNKAAVLSLTHIFQQVAKSPQAMLLTQLHTAGMMCVRAIRGTTDVYSNHSWGCAIDLYFGSDVVEYGSPFTQQGLLDLYPFFHASGWYSGMGFRARHDSMHMEASESLVETWRGLGLT